MGSIELIIAIGGVLCGLPLLLSLIFIVFTFISTRNEGKRLMEIARELGFSFTPSNLSMNGNYKGYFLTVRSCFRQSFDMKSSNKRVNISLHRDKSLKGELFIGNNVDFWFKPSMIFKSVRGTAVDINQFDKAFDVKGNLPFSITEKILDPEIKNKILNLYVAGINIWENKVECDIYGTIVKEKDKERLSSAIELAVSIARRCDELDNEPVITRKAITYRQMEEE